MQTRAARRRGIVLAVVGLAAGLAGGGCTRPVVSSEEPLPALTSAGRCRVMGPGSGPDPAQERVLLRDACERALPAVARTWPDWTGPALVVVSATELEPGTAAYVDGLARDGEPARADRLVVAPGLSAELSGEGLDIVLRHELTHLAMRSTGTAPLPLWVSEGIAMHVGYAPVADARRERRPELERLRVRVESGAWTGTVPDEALFDAPEHRSEAYTAAWLAIETLLEHQGPDRVTRAMSAQDASPDRGAAPLSDAERTQRFLGSLGVSREWLDEQWRAALERRAS